MQRFIITGLWYLGIVLLLAGCGGGSSDAPAPTRATVDVAFNQSAIDKINATPNQKLVILGLHILSDIPVATTPPPVLSLGNDLKNGNPATDFNSTAYSIGWIGETSVSTGQILFGVTYTLASGVPQFSIDPTSIKAETFLTGGTSTPVPLVPSDFKLTVSIQ